MPDAKHAPIVTQKGTNLPMMDIKGKPYLQVAHRLVWFREAHPGGSIMTELIEHDKENHYAIFSAKVIVDDKIIATAMKMESVKHFPDYLEKAETGSIGRALSIAGFGTQFSPELDEGDRLADSPVAPAKKNTKAVTKEPEKCRNCNGTNVTQSPSKKHLGRAYWQCADCYESDPLKSFSHLVEEGDETTEVKAEIKALVAAQEAPLSDEEFFPDAE